VSTDVANLSHVESSDCWCIIDKVINDSELPWSGADEASYIGTGGMDSI